MSEPGKPPSAAAPAASDRSLAPLHPEPVTDDEAAPLLDRAFAGAGAVLLAVSGGSDSMALLHLTARWLSGRSKQTPAICVAPIICIATVDHGLRDGSAGEAAWVAGVCTRLGLAHRTLVWEGNKPAAGVQAAARAARYGMLVDLAATLGPPPAVIAVAHTLDDQAETLLMRLARGSGVDGLAAMAERRREWSAATGDVVDIVRPLLGFAKARLVATLNAAGLAWLEDPSNAVERFERVRLRQQLAGLALAGLEPSAVATSARRLQRARRALETATLALEQDAVDDHEGIFARIDLGKLTAAPEEIGLRLLTRILARVGGQAETPPMRQMEELLARVQYDRPFAHSVSGTLVRQGAGSIDVFREPGRQGLRATPLLPDSHVIWDRRFRVSASTGNDFRSPDRTEQSEPAVYTVRALADAELDAVLRSHPLDRKAWPRRALLTVPSIWNDDVLIAIPHLALGRVAAAQHRLDVGLGTSVRTTFVVLPVRPDAARVGA